MCPILTFPHNMLISDSERELSEMALWMRQEVESAVREVMATVREGPETDLTGITELLIQRLVRVPVVRRTQDAFNDAKAEPTGLDAATRVVRALAKKPALLEQVTDLLVAIRGSDPAAANFFSATFVG